MIKYIILAVVAILVLSYFGYDIQAIVESPTTQKNLSYTEGGVSHVWNEYLKEPILYFWHKIFIGILWNAFIHNLGRIDAGAPSELEGAGQRLLHIGDQGYTPIDQ
jgi:hypothetical protein